MVEKVSCILPKFLLVSLRSFSWAFSKVSVPKMGNSVICHAMTLHRPQQRRQQAREGWPCCETDGLKAWPCDQGHRAASGCRYALIDKGGRFDVVQRCSTAVRSGVVCATWTSVGMRSANKRWRSRWSEGWLYYLAVLPLIGSWNVR